MSSPNPLRDFIDKTGMTLRAWSILNGIPYSTIYPIYNGDRLPKRTVAIRLHKASSGYLTLRDFGFED